MAVDPIDEMCDRALKHAGNPEAEVPKLQELVNDLVVVVRAMRAAGRVGWEDKDDLYTPDIKAAHPLQTKRFDIYQNAIALVSARRDKYALIDCMNWLLARIDKLMNVARLAASARKTGAVHAKLDLDDALKELGY